MSETRKPTADELYAALPESAQAFHAGFTAGLDHGRREDGDDRTRALHGTERPWPFAPGGTHGPPLPEHGGVDATPPAPARSAPPQHLAWCPPEGSIHGCNRAALCEVEGGCPPAPPPAGGSAEAGPKRSSWRTPLTPDECEAALHRVAGTGSKRGHPDYAYLVSSDACAWALDELARLRALAAEREKWRTLALAARTMAWTYGRHREGCPLFADIDDDKAKCSCDFDPLADAVCDAEDALDLPSCSTFPSHAAQEAALAGWRVVSHTDPERERLVRALRTATTRLGILRDRMEACEADHPDTHRVSLTEVPAWIEEQEAIL